MKNKQQNDKGIKKKVVENDKKKATTEKKLILSNCLSARIISFEQQPKR